MPAPFLVGKDERWRSASERLAQRIDGKEQRPFVGCSRRELIRREIDDRVDDCVAGMRCGSNARAFALLPDKGWGRVSWPSEFTARDGRRTIARRGLVIGRPQWGARRQQQNQQASAPDQIHFDARIPAGAGVTDQALLT